LSDEVASPASSGPGLVPATVRLAEARLMKRLMSSFRGGSTGSNPVGGISATGISPMWFRRRRARPLDALLLGGGTAAALGVKLGRTWHRLFTAAAVLIGVMVAVSGSTGVVVTMIPHAVRRVIGPDHRRRRCRRRRHLVRVPNRSCLTSRRRRARRILVDDCRIRHDRWVPEPVAPPLAVRLPRRGTTKETPWQA
jgi:hypothetical protein